MTDKKIDYKTDYIQYFEKYTTNNKTYCLFCSYNCPLTDSCNLEMPNHIKIEMMKKYLLKYKINKIREII